MCVCTLSDIRYVEWRDEEIQVWLVDPDGVPVQHLRRVKYDEVDEDIEPSHLVSYEPFKCALCQMWFMSWDDVLYHLEVDEDGKLVLY